MKQILKRGLIVSCQALPDEPLHSSFIMGRMALAAYQGGAVGIRANSIEDIKEIKSIVNLPIIGIIKRVYPNKNVYITPTMKEVDELVQTGVDVIALDATIDQEEEFLKSVLKKYPDQQFMADISTLYEGRRAANLGFQYIGTTLVGYTSQSKGIRKLELLNDLIIECKSNMKSNIIAEGNFDTPELAAKAIEMGAYAVVVGSAITRPQYITKKFAQKVMAQLKKFNDKNNKL
ncbi:N-acetylmannosamine-6-phosphate 2-epimerase [Thermoanaerobacterium thermosaccharolyticum]|uniref:N-acetylmannosamine-6-phosphate 2-epimerase n=1 Tax=Thermoanaerobacterium thermosaccharolyticum TaxID=1517 RepID=UPI0020A38E49|nr:N-acetylmannosamine-6-phosphate 2-epimerase [Thermoanaerobacterium thermosaccharolyticum]MCP2239770.1 N-acylglucosamine-6-phosphate 2-epimerase [Thermoanaerobacterium thermosaccharolyticum]